MKRIAQISRPTRRRALQLAGAALATAVVSRPNRASAQRAKTLRFVPEADLRSLDPIWTTIYITGNYGYMVYDTLFAFDSNFNPQPQMVEGWNSSADKLKHDFTLRGGMKWHDGEPVRAEDCVVSLTRWMNRDVMGQSMGQAVGEMKATGNNGFTIELKQPFPLLHEGLAKMATSTPFMMPERVAKTPGNRQITETVGSGPFKFVRSEWVPGSKVVYVKNEDYVPRKEAPSWGSGGKVAKFDRVEWLYIPDSGTALNALIAGEVDWWQQVPADLVPLLKERKGVTVSKLDPLGTVGILKFNHLQPPFNNEKVRQAVLQVLDQKEFMSVVAGDPSNWRTCFSYFGCGTPMGSEIGSEMLSGPRDMAKAKRLLAESGYKGERTVILDASDQPIMHSQALVAADLLQRIGFNVDLQTMDWATVISRRVSREPVDKGGWSIYFTYTAVVDALSPLLNTSLRANGTSGSFGWPSNEKLEQLRAEWIVAPTLEEQKRLAGEIQTEGFRFVSYITTGQFQIPTAYRDDLRDIIVAPSVFMWNVNRK